MVMSAMVQMRGKIAYLSQTESGDGVQSRGKIECSYQRGKAKLNKTFHLSPNENICTWRYNIKKD